jgi:hypothetical protein
MYIGVMRLLLNFNYCAFLKTAAEAELEITRADQQRLAAALKAEIEAEKIRMELAMAPLDISIAPSYSSQLIQVRNLPKL